jgi:CRP-like cAMP-binding protein
VANPLTMKLEQFARLDQADRARLDQLLTHKTRTFSAGETIIPEGKRVRNVHLILRGLAARQKTLRNGARQIMAFLIPGDLCDIEVFVLQAMDHDIVALSETTCLLIPEDVVEHLLTDGSQLTRALWWGTMVDSAILREWIVDHGSRDAREQIAHIIFELLVRYRIVGETTDNSYAFPITQEQLATATGMSAVHANRTLQTLRSEGLIELSNKVMTVLDPERLRKVARFNPNYLHLIRTEARDKEVSGRAGDLIPPERHAVLDRLVDALKPAPK